MRDAIVDRGGSIVLRATAALFATACVAAPSFADKVIDRYVPSLTTYMPTGRSSSQGVRPNVTDRAVNIDGSVNWPQGAASGGGLLPPGSGLQLDPWTGMPDVIDDGGGGDECGGDEPGFPFIGKLVPPSQEALGAPPNRLGGISLSTGSWRIEQLDLALPAPGFSWRIARSYSAAQTEDEDPIDSDGFQGSNWFQSSAPELVYVPGAAGEEMIYIVWGAAAYTEFLRNGPTANVFKSKNGANAAMQYTAGSPDLWTVTAPTGATMTFFGGNTYLNNANWQLWKIEDPAGNVAYVGHKTDPETAAAEGYTAGRMTTAYDTADRRYTYTYTEIDDLIFRLTQVKVETKSGGTWASPTGLAEVARVDYTYYIDNDPDIAHGTQGDLRLVKVTLPLSDSGLFRESRRYFRYWKGTWSGGNPGQAHLVKHALDSEGCRRFSLNDATLFAATDSALKPYAQASFEYDADRRIVKTWSFGACGCGGGSANGASEIAYEPNTSFTGTSGYDPDWKARVIVSRPDGTWLTQYLDEVGQSLSRVITPMDPASRTSSTDTQWTTYVSRDHPSDAELDGFVHEISQIDNVSGYDHATGAFTRAGGAGRVRFAVRETSGDRKGLLLDRTRSIAGTGGARYLDSSRTFVSSDPSLTIGSGGGSNQITLLRPLPASTRSYTQPITSGTTGSILTTLSYTFWSGAAATQPQTITITLPAVSTANNGEDVTHTIVRYLRKDGTTAFVKGPDGIYTYTQFENGRLVKRIDDCVLNHGGDFAAGDDPNGDFGITETGAGLRQITTMTYDTQGRLDVTTLHAQAGTEAEHIRRKRYYTKLADGLDLTLTYADYEPGGTPKYFGPIGCAVTNHAGAAEAQATIAISQSGITTALTSHVDETETDLIDAIGIGSIARLSTSVFDAAGHHRLESRGYFTIPTSLPGTEGTHYDATRYAYDDAGRLIRTKTADGTITRTDFNGDARPYRTRIGTNDEGEPEGEPSGTNNMTVVSQQVYDTVGRVIESRSFYDTGGGDYRTTEYLYDANARVTVTLPPVAPYAVRKFDHLGRTVAQGLYSSPSGLSAATDPTSTSTNRIALNEMSYDERGRTWKTTRWKIDQSNGAKYQDSESPLVAEHWFDAAGRVIKSDDEQLTKTSYDRLGRATHQFILAAHDDDDDDYADACDIAGDIVLEEHQTVYDAINGNVLMSVSIARRQDDYGGGETTGPLDSNADNDRTKVTPADVEGRPSITATWYDHLGRMTATVAYGTNGGTTFTRPSTAPGSSSDILVSTTTYNDDGSVLETTDPRGKKRRTLYDALGRVTATISNYVDGTPSSPTGDDDVYIRQAYTNGLHTKYWVDLNGDGIEDSDDQVTTYTYGVTKGGSPGDSKIAMGSLLQKVTYPDSVSGSDVVTYAYDVSRAQTWRKEQMGTIIETNYDAGGRRQHERVTTFGSGIDQAVKRITYGYDAHGRMETITSWNNAAPASGSIVNQVQSTWDDWGNLMSFKVDPDSAIGGGGVPTKQIAYTYAVATNGRNTIRRASATLPGAVTVNYIYGAGANNAYADEASRLQRMEISSVPVAEYAYLGVGHVVGIEYPQPSVFQRRYDATSGTWPDLDRFGRVIHSRWTKDLTTDMDFFSVEIEYDENSNPKITKDNVYPTGFDVKYAIDGLDRLRDADEGTLLDAGGGAWAVSSRTRRQEWTELTQTGNWKRSKLDLNGDGAWGAANEYDDSRTHNTVNEILTRDVDSNGTANYTLTHDAAGNLTDDGKDYVYVYDAWYRLRQIKTRTTGDLVSEHQYYGNGFRSGEHYDSNDDAKVESSDKWFWFAYDERWRIVGTYRDTDGHPKERFLHHNAGLGGYGSSSYIDTLVLRDRDASTDWNDDASDGTLEERLYYCQNWRHDVVALVTSGGALRERVRYFSYGIPYGIPLGDVNGDGVVNNTDRSILNGAWGTATARCDLNLDGTVDATDHAIQGGELSATGGFGKLSRNRNRFGYAGYVADPAINSDWHVRHRVLLSELGRWSRRDPLGYEDGMSLYRYSQSSPVRLTDYLGLCANGSIKSSHSVIDYPLPPEFVGPPTIEQECCTFACSRPSPYPPAGRTVCCYGAALSCICMVNMRVIDPATQPFVDHYTACIHRCEPIHQQNIDCGMADPTKIILPAPFGAPGGLPWIDYACGGLCSECTVQTCAAGCIAEYDCTNSTVPNCEAIKQNIVQKYRETRSYSCALCNICLGQHTICYN